MCADDTNQILSQSWFLWWRQRTVERHLFQTEKKTRRKVQIKLGSLEKFVCVFHIRCVFATQHSKIGIYLLSSTNSQKCEKCVALRAPRIFESVHIHIMANFRMRWKTSISVSSVFGSKIWSSIWFCFVRHTIIWAYIHLRCVDDSESV